MKRIFLIIYLALCLNLYSNDLELQAELFKGSLAHANKNYNLAISHYIKYKKLSVNKADGYNDVLKLLVYSIYRGDRCDMFIEISEYDKELIEAKFEDNFKKDYQEVVEFCAEKLIKN